ncbi:MAG TPA: hypothetical protein EYG04_03500, partial [Candidatus Poseidoniales archaeon]|nr:hypothetical protein [Candidatus Poseidoniales archaeon]
MEREHSLKSGPLRATLILAEMDIDDDDLDAIHLCVSVENESAIPMGGLVATVKTSTGKMIEPTSGVTSIGPGLSREYVFDFHIDEGEWTFVIEHDGAGGRKKLDLGPYGFDFEFTANIARKMSNAMGSSMFEGAFDMNLGDFGSVSERELIDKSAVILTDYEAEDSLGGETKISIEDSSAIPAANSESVNDKMSEEHAMSSRNELFESLSPPPAPLSPLTAPLSAPTAPLSPLTAPL